MKRIIYIFLLLSIIFCQEIISLTPSEASQGEAVEMIMVVDDINLENFKSIRFSFFDSYDPYFDYYLYVHDENEDGESCVEPYATSPDTIIFSLSISATAPVGDYTAFVYTGWNDDDITVGSDMFTVNDGFYPYSTLSDIDGNIYEIAAIGDQLWMQENLEVTHFSNGDPIPQVNSDYAWWDLDTPGYTNLGYPYSQWSERMGNYYNWYAASDERGICPEGWHVATDSDFNELEVLLASENYYDPYDQSYLMENMTESIVFSNWTDGSFDTCYEWNLYLEEPINMNESGFSARGSGYEGCCDNYRYHEDVFEAAYYWVYDPDAIVFSDDNYFDPYASRNIKIYSSGTYYHQPWGDGFDYNKQYGFSIRCVADSEAYDDGDVNNDGEINILDIVQVVNFILSNLEFSELQISAGDINNDDIINVLDIAILVNFILNN